MKSKLSQLVLMTKHNKGKLNVFHWNIRSLFSKNDSLINIIIRNETNKLIGNIIKCKSKL